jgi:hypothetical protein
MMVPLCNTTESYDSYVLVCSTYSRMLESESLSTADRDSVIDWICKAHDSFKGIENTHPKAFARIFIMRLARSDRKRKIKEGKINNPDLFGLYNKWWWRPDCE